MKTTYLWVGFPAAVMFVFGKCVGFIPHSWLWIIPICLLWCKKNSKEKK